MAISLGILTQHFQTNPCPNPRCSKDLFPARPSVRSRSSPSFPAPPTQPEPWVSMRRPSAPASCRAWAAKKLVEFLKNGRKSRDFHGKNHENPWKTHGKSHEKQRKTMEKTSRNCDLSYLTIKILDSIIWRFGVNARKRVAPKMRTSQATLLIGQKWYILPPNNWDSTHSACL